MTIQTFTAGQKLTALQMNTLQASDFNFTRNVRTDSSYTFTLADRGKLVESTNAGSAVFTIPLNSTAEFSIGDRIDTLLASDGSLQVVGASGVTLYAEGDLTTISSKWTRVTLIKRATDSWVMTGSGMSVQTVELDNLAVTEAKLADSSVTSAKIVDGTIVNADVNTSAAIALSKLASGTSAQVVVANSGGVPTYTTLSGDVTIGNTGVTAIGSGKVTSSMILDGTIVDGDVSSSASIALSKLATGALPTSITVASVNIVNGTIVNEDVSASAAIAHTKLANATAGQVLLGTTTTGVVTATTVSGDVTITGAGVTAIGSGVIVDADVSATAAISRGKIANMSIDTKTENYTLVLTDANKLIEMNITSTANTVSVPTNASVAFPIGTEINITQYGTGKTQIVAVTSGTTSVRSTPGSYLRDRYSSATLIKRATDEWYLIGDLSAS